MGEWVVAGLHLALLTLEAIYAYGTDYQMYIDIGAQILLSMFEQLASWGRQFATECTEYVIDGAARFRQFCGDRSNFPAIFFGVIAFLFIVAVALSLGAGRQ